VTGLKPRLQMQTACRIRLARFTEERYYRASREQARQRLNDTVKLN